MSTLESVKTLVLNDPSLSKDHRRRILVAVENADYVGDEYSPLDELVTRKEAGKLLGMCSGTIKRYQSKGMLKAIYLTPKTVRYKKSDVLKLLRNGVDPWTSREGMLSGVRTMARKRAGDKAAAAIR